VPDRQEKLQMTKNNTQINFKYQLSNLDIANFHYFGHLDLEFICILRFAICDFSIKGSFKNYSIK